MYITGGGRTYYLTHMGSRTVRLGQTVRRGQVIGTIADYPDRPDHIHEGIHGGGMSVQGAATSAGMVVPLRLVPRPRITGGGAVGRATQRALRLATVGANNLLRGAAGAPEAGPATVGRVINVRGAGLQSVNRVFPLHHTGTPGAQLSRSTVRRIAASVGFPPIAGEQISRGESGNQPGIVEWPPEADGAQGIGLMQMTTGHVDPPVVALINRLGGWNQMRNPIKNFIAAEKLREIGGLGRWHGTRYLTGHRRGGLLSLPRFQNGGPLATAAAARRPRAVRAPQPIKAPIDALAGAVGTVNSLFTDVLGDLRKMVGGLDKTKGLAKRIRVASEKLTEDGGVLDTLHEAVAGIAERGALALQRGQFRIARGGRPVRRDLTAAEIARAGIVTTQATGEALAGERTTLQGSIADEQRALNVAVKRKNKAAQTAARAALANLRARLEQNATDIAQNVQDQVEAVESYQQALLDAVNQHADDANARLDRATRTARALGVSLDPNAVIDRQIATTRTQIAGLEEVLRQARRSHNAELVRTVTGQIAELNVQIAEAVAQQFQNAIDAVNTTAQQQTTRLDRAARRAQIGGTDYAALGDTLVARQGVLANQRAGLVALLAQAVAAGNVDQITNLTDQIDDLDTAMAENTQAVKDNTDAAFNDRTQLVNEQFGFAQTVLTGAQGFFRGLSDATGISTLPQQLSALRSLAVALGAQQQGLEGQLAALTGDQSVLGLTGTGLVDYLLSISTGPRMQAIMNMLDPTQQAAFRDLVTSLLANASATQENTKAIGDLTGSNAQSFSSSFWTSFRTAVFTGAGGLLPTYAMTIPGAAIGARVMTSGALMVHAGETVRPAAVSRNMSGGDGGDTYVVNVTSPTQVLDPTHVNRELAFMRRTSGR
jgi:tetratricopeptide (TPR) repeat protein